MSAQSNIELIQKLYAAFGRGDVATILEHLTEDVIWGVVSHSRRASSVPWHEQLAGRANVPKFFVALGQNAEFTRFEPHAFVASDDYVYCSVTWDAVHKPSGRKMTQTVIHRFRIQNGKIAEWRGTEDTAATLELVGAM